MHHDLAVIHHHPAGVGFPFDPAFAFMVCQRFFDHAISQGVQHPVTGGSTDDKVVSEGSDLFNIQQEDVLAFFIFQCINNGMCQFERIQISPLDFYAIGSV
jgi:hypothetical protein